jgi:hypothetical protein
VQNEPNFAPVQTPDGGNSAEQSQTWEDWGTWARTVVWAAARPGSQTCKTNPILGVSGYQETPYGVTTNGTKTCKTNPIWPLGGGRRRRNAQNEPNFSMADVGWTPASAARPPAATKEWLTQSHRDHKEECFGVVPFTFVALWLRVRTKYLSSKSLGTVDD